MLKIQQDYICVDLEGYFGTFPVAIASKYSDMRYSKLALKRRRRRKDEVTLFKVKLSCLVGGLVTAGQDSKINFLRVHGTSALVGQGLFCLWLKGLENNKELLENIHRFYCGYKENRHVYYLLR